MIRIDHLMLPAGLDAVAHRTGPGELFIVVSDRLEPGEQRAAVRAAIRSARRHAWEFGLLPLPLAAGLTPPAAMRHVFAAVRGHAVITTVTGTLAAAAAAVAAVFIVTAPAPHQHPAAAPPGYSQSVAPAATGPASARPGTRAPAGPSGARHTVTTVASPGTGAQPTQGASPQPNPTTGGTTPPTQPPVGQPPPATSSPVQSAPPSPQPTTSASPSPSHGGGKTCVILLGIVVCL